MGSNVSATDDHSSSGAAEAGSVPMVTAGANVIGRTAQVTSTRIIDGMAKTVSAVTLPTRHLRRSARVPVRAGEGRVCVLLEAAA
ncbi:hypothetical protein GCM10023318_44780 [Nocardia callitridis]|uniref:Uncharacterized protein n=1 Tax=Nocardia callitridis TaxID=648753 RepID=A0ABP9KM65_9NOCA